MDSDYFVVSITNTCPYIETAALKLNIRLARRKFEDLQSDSLVSWFGFTYIPAFFFLLC